jgi:phosphoglycerate-specific signal transduction histidine kinase
VTAVKLALSKPVVGAVLLCALVLALGACGDDESEAEKAQNDVCDARADIEKQVDELSSLTLSTATIDGIKGNLQAIEKDLGEIKDAEGDLNDERKQQVQSATQQFTSELESVVDTVGKSTSLDQAASQLSSAFDDLAQSFEQTLTPIDCG